MCLVLGTRSGSTDVKSIHSIAVKVRRALCQVCVKVRRVTMEVLLHDLSDGFHLCLVAGTLHWRR